MKKKSDVLRNEILKKVREYSRSVHQQQYLPDNRNCQFVPGETIVPYAGRVFSEDEVEAAVSSTLDFWLTLGKEGAAFEEELKDRLGVKGSLLTNSGSSANLLAISVLTSSKIPEGKRFLRGDEVITCAVGFPTTVAPIIQNGLIPVFLDCDPVTGNISSVQLQEAYRAGKTKAVILAHTLGNPFDLATVIAFCKKHGLWLIEDNCDALGSEYWMPVSRAEVLEVSHLLKIARGGIHPLIRLEGANQEWLVAPTGVWGDFSTQSFYPPHHLTMGEGGCINIVKNLRLRKIAESFRDWGRDCFCPSGKDNSCLKRFGWQLGELPEGYDHKYIYSHLGYNLKPLDLQAAIGRCQLNKLDQFIGARKRNWEFLRSELASLSDVFTFTLPTHATKWNSNGFDWDSTDCRTSSSWFGFMLLINKDAPFSRNEFAVFLDGKKIGNRMLFGGNLVRQPAFVDLKKDSPESFRVIGNLKGSDRIMNEAIFIGVYPGLSKEMLVYVVECIREFVKMKRR
jgi:CDP-4-dehydro-6-deoxyglucose reductase, E1